MSDEDSIMRLVSAVYVLPCPMVNQPMKTSFAASFDTATKDHPNSVTLMRSSDTARRKLADALEQVRSVANVPGSKHQNVLNLAKDYVPKIHRILFSCKVQPEMAVLNKKLEFQWISGMENNKHVKKDDALMYELAISIATCSLASAGAASEEAVAGRFPAAAKLFNAAAGAQTCLHEDLLPQWITLGSETEVSQLPSEVAGPVAEAFRGLYLAHAQQMAVATALTKGASPANYSLLAKLCRGLKEEMQGFVEAMRSHAAAQYSKMNPSLTVFITFQMGIYESMMHYFWARLMWSKDKYGLAIAILHKAAAWAETRKYASAAVGIPDPADRSSPVKAVEKDILDYRGHLRSLLDEWEKDNRTVYFDSVPNSVKEEDLVTKGVVIKKPEAFVLESPEPVQLGPKARTEMRAPPPQVLPRFNSGSGLPPGFITPAPVALPPEDDLPPPVYAPQQLQRTDSDLAREMQAKFDMHGQ